MLTASVSRLPSEPRPLPAHSQGTIFVKSQRDHGRALRSPTDSGPVPLLMRRAGQGQESTDDVGQRVRHGLVDGLLMAAGTLTFWIAVVLGFAPAPRPGSAGAAWIAPIR